MKQLMGILLKQ